MTGRILLGLAAALLALPLGAQVAEPPQIDLPAGQTAAPQAPAPALMPPVEAPLTPVVPEITLPEIPAGGATTPPSAVADPAQPPAPIARDKGAAEGAQAAEWLMPMFPANTQLPTTGGMGQSLPEPGILRLTGEVATGELTLMLPEGTILPGEVIFTLRSSINVLAESARMAVTVNGGDPVEVPLDRLGPFATLRLPVTGLMPGANSIGLTLRQPHRIFCSPEASFGVWTEIDLGNSGAAIPPQALIADSAGFALALRSQVAGGRAVSILADDSTDAAVLRKVSDQIARLMGGQGRIEIGSFYAIGPQPHAAVAVIASDKAQATFRRGASGAIILQVEYTGEAVPDLAAILGEPAKAGPVSAPAVVPGQTVDLATLGMGDAIGNTRYYRKDLVFTLPADWLLLANQKAELNLHYGFAKGLPEGAILLVKANETTIRLLPLDVQGGALLPPLPVGFNANLLHTGRNTLSFEMMVPGNPPDEVCPPRRADMLVLMGDSTLTIPPSPAMALTGMAGVLGGLAPAGILAPADAADRAGLERVALQIAAGLTAPEVPAPDTTLTVVGLNDLALVPMASVGLMPRQVQDLLFPLAPRAPKAAADAPAAAPTFRLTEDGEEQTAAPAPSGPGLMDRMFSGVTRIFTAEGWFAREATALASTAFLGSDQSLPQWIAGKSANALLLRPEADLPGSLWLILGPAAAPDQVAIALTRLRTDGLARGEAALLQADGTWQVWSPIRLPALLETPDAGNLRTILGNYASWSPLLFTMGMLFLALLSALPALFYILLSRGRRNEP